MFGTPDSEVTRWLRATGRNSGSVTERLLTTTAAPTARWLWTTESPKQ